MFSTHVRRSYFNIEYVFAAIVLSVIALLVTSASAQIPRTLEFNGPNESEQIPGLVDPFEDDQQDASSILDDLPPFEDVQENNQSPADAPYNAESAFGDPE